MEPGRVKYVLKYPVQHGSELISELNLRRIKGKDMRSITAGAERSTATTLDLISKLSGQAPAVIDELDAWDIGEVSKIVEGFTEGGPPTGDGSSPS